MGFNSGFKGLRNQQSTESRLPEDCSRKISLNLSLGIVTFLRLYALSNINFVAVVILDLYSRGSGCQCWSEYRL